MRISFLLSAMGINLKMARQNGKIKNLLSNAGVNFIKARQNLIKIKTLSEASVVLARKNRWIFKNPVLCAARQNVKISALLSAAGVKIEKGWQDFKKIATLSDAVVTAPRQKKWVLISLPVLSKAQRKRRMIKDIAIWYVHRSVLRMRS